MDVTAVECPEQANAAGDGMQGQELHHGKPGHVRTHFVNQIPQEEVLEQQSKKKT